MAPAGAQLLHMMPVFLHTSCQVFPLGMGLHLTWGMLMCIWPVCIKLTKDHGGAHYHHPIKVVYVGRLSMAGCCRTPGGRVSSSQSWSFVETSFEDSLLMGKGGVPRGVWGSVEGLFCLICIFSLYVF